MKKTFLSFTLVFLALPLFGQLIVSRPATSINSAADLDNYNQLAYVVFGDSIKNYMAELNFLASPAEGRVVYSFENYDRGFFRLGGIVPEDVKIGSKNYLVKDMGLTFDAFAQPVVLYDLTQKFGEPEVKDNGYFWTTSNFSIGLKEAVNSTIIVVFNYIRI